MNFRQSEISQMLSDWLDRYVPPKNLSDKPEAAQKEFEAHLKAILKFAPRSEYQPFVHQVFDRLDLQMKTRAWPTVGELGAVCSNLRKEQPRPLDLTGEPKGKDGCEIAAQRMAAGEPVGEGYLYGALAVELAARRLVSEDVMTRYRSAAFFARKDILGEAKAMEWEAEAKQRHESAKSVYRQRNAEREARNVTAPDKRTPVPASYGDWDAA